jgi:hypothetical protein
MRILLVLCFAILLTSCNYNKQKFYESSIQGYEASDKKNGVHDLTISDQSVENFLTALKVYTDANDRWKLSTMVEYPISPFINDKEKEINSQDQFVANFDAIFNDKVKSAILEADKSDLFVNTHGFMIGNGEVWFAKSAKTGKLVVIDINNY